MIPSETIYYVGLALIGFAVLVTAIVIPIFILTRKTLRKQLDMDYGERNPRVIHK